MHVTIAKRLVEETKNLSSGLLSANLLVIHNTIGRGQNNVTKLSRWKYVLHPLLHIVHFAVKARRDNSTLIDSANQIHDNLASAVVIQNLKLANISFAEQRNKSARRRNI